MAEGSKLQDWLDEQKTPATPVGQQQVAEAGYNKQVGTPGYEQSKLGSWLEDQKSYTDMAQSWYTGANQDGTGNGWDTSFVERFIAGQNQAAESNSLGDYFSQENVTGVATWDHTTKDGRAIRFGDVYDNGKFQGNLYDQFGKTDADLMMADWLFDGKTKAEIFSDDDRTTRLTQEVEAKRQQNNVDIPKALQAQEFAEKVEGREEDFAGTAGDTGVTLAGVAGGLTVAGGAAAATGVGAVPGAIIAGVGGALGGLAAWLNRDELQEQAARAYEITALANQENGFGAGFATGVKEWAGFGGKFIAPLGNLTHGLYDVTEGSGGDGTSEFYRLDKEGDSQVPTWVKIADVGATIGDSLLQFASPIGLTAYSAQMSGVIGGEVASLALSGGETFDDRRGGFDNIFTDDNGDFDLSSAAAGLGKIGIDAVQLGIARGLAGKANASMAAVGKEGVYRTSAIGSRLPSWLGGTPQEAAAALKAGGKTVEAAGFKFTLDAAGNVVSKRATLSLLAPSEQLSSLSARVIGTREAAKRAGAYSADDFYRAAQAMSAGERKLTTALVNGFGEGYEEAVQAMLEPLSHNASFTGQEVFNSFVYGAAGGVGMGLGFGAHTATADQKMFSQAQVAQMMRTGGVQLTEREWAAMSDVEKRTLAGLGKLDKATAEAAYRKVAEEQAAEQVAGVVGVAKLQDAINGELAKNLARATDRTDGSFVISPLEDGGVVAPDGSLLPGSMPSDAIGSSARQLAMNLTNLARGAVIQRDEIAQKLAEATAGGDPDTIAARQRQLDQVELTLSWAQRVDTMIDDALRRLYDPARTEQTVEADSIALNEFLRQAYHREIDSVQGVALTPDDKMALARSVSVLAARDPHDQAGSYQMMLPQVSAKLTLSNSDEVLQISSAVLDAIRGDYDGDKVRLLNQLILDENEYAAARSGSHFLGAGTSVNVGAPKYERWQLEFLRDAITGNNATLSSFATQSLVQIGDTIRNRYTGIVDDAVLDEVLGTFFTAAKAGSKDARATLLDGLAAKAGGPINEFARGNLSNEWLWIDQVVRSSLQRFQEAYAAHRPDLGPDPDTTTVTPNRQTTDVKERKMARAATLGQTLGLWTPGDSMFRKFQKLHYSIIGAPVKSADGRDIDVTLQEMALLYESLGQGMTQAEVDSVRAKDDITARVYVQLQRMANDAQRELATQGVRVNPSEAMTVVANLEVVDIYNDKGEVVGNGKPITLAQLLLKRSVQRDAREKQAILDASPELQSKHARLLSMTRPGSRDNPVNAERAFVEVVGSQQFYTLLGDDSGIFGPHLTVEQFIRYYVSLNEKDRRRLGQKLRGEAAYLGRKQSKDMPYAIDELQDVSAFRAVVDAVLGVGNHRISMADNGTLSGELADKSQNTSRAFRNAHATIRTALREFAGLSPQQDGALSTDLVARMLESNPDFARQVMNLIPNAVANVVFEQRGDDTFIANWVYQMLAENDAKTAEMIYWRNVLLSEWNALGVRTQVTEEETDDGQSARQFDRLPRRMHRIMYKLARENDGGFLLQQFIERLTQSTDIDSFIQWVNTTAGVRGEQAPITAWVDDVADFDADKAQGGWTTALQGAELREAIGTLQKGSNRLLKELSDERAALLADTQAIQEIRAALRSGDTENALLRQLEKTIELASETALGMGPQAMVYQTVGAVRGFYPQAHTKGKNPDNVEPAGAFDAMRDAFDYVTNFERMMGSVTAVNLDAVGGNLSQLSKDSVRSMDDYGRQVEWTKPSVEQMLGLFENPDTRPLARAILFPQVMERTLDGRLSPQMLVGKSLRGLLSGSTHKDLFPKNGRLSQEAAFKYVAMVEATARKFGGHFSVQRAVNDIVIARTSNANHVLSVEELERMTVQAYQEVARVLQATGAVAARPTEPGADPLGDILRSAKQEHKRQRMGKQLGLAGDEQMLTDLAVDELISARERQLQDEINDLLARIAADPTMEVVLQAQIEAANTDFDTFRARADMLRSDDYVAEVVAMFDLPQDPAAAAPKKSALIRYVATHPSMMERASASKLLLLKITSQMMDSGRNGQIDLEDKEWTELSRAVISLYLDDASSLTASNVSVPPFPEIESNQRYYDSSFGYLADPLVSADSPLVQAAAEIHKRAGRQDTIVTDVEILEALGRSVFDDKRLGVWTGDIPRASVEANQRLDSAAAAPAIAMAGNSPKRQAAISAATRRTFQVPGEELLSKIDVAFPVLNRPLYDEVIVTMPGGAQASRPLAQLNNRFARSVTATFPDGTVVDLLAEDRNLGRTWYGNTMVENSGYAEIHLDRLQSAVTTAALNRGFSPGEASVSVEFFHPDSQPDSPEWYNNIFFEGTSFKLDADRHESLNSTLWFANDSISPRAQAAALDASKLGKPALQVIDVADSYDVAQIEANWMADLAGVLRAKTKMILEKDLGDGKLDPEFYNAVYKNLKLRHFVRYADDMGEIHLLTSEQVIAMQQRGEQVPSGTLWIPTDDVLRSMLGEMGTQGVARIFGDTLDIDLSRIPTYKGVTDTMVERFAGGFASDPIGVEQTRIAARGRQGQLEVRPMLSDQEKSAYDQRMRFLRAAQSEIQTDRSQLQRIEEGGFNPRNNLAAAMRAGDKMLRAENIAFDWFGAGIPFIGPRNPGDTALSQMLIHELAASLEPDGFRTGWIYREGGQSRLPAGELSEVSLGADRPGFRVALGDLVVMELDSFQGDTALAKKRVDYMVDHGATVVLGASDGQADLRAEISDYLESRNYEKIIGSVHVYKPLDTSSRYQNLKARESSLTEVTGVSTKSKLAIFNTIGLPIQEGGAWAVADDRRLQAVAVTMNLVPTDFLADYNVPVDSVQVDAVRAHLRGLTQAGGRQLLLDQANGHLQGAERDTADQELSSALDKMLAQFDTNLGTVLPVAGDSFGTGDLIPLVDTMGRVLLYRHGYKAPSRFKVAEMQAQAMPGKIDAANVAIFPTKREPQATTHVGEVVAFRPRAGYGLQVELNIPLQVFGDKKQLEWNGMKFILTPKPDSIVLPDHGLFPNWGINLVTDADTAFSKESYGGLVDNHRNAFAFLGIDFLADVKKFLFQGQAVDDRTAEGVLHAIATRAPRLSVAAADELLNSQRLGTELVSLLDGFGREQQALGTAADWLNRLDESSIEAKIASSIIIYLMTPGARVEHVLRSGGFNDETAGPDSQSILMPRLFTQVFDNAPLGSDLRKEINRRLNEKLYNPNTDGTGYRLLQNFQFEVINADRKKNMVGFLQFAEAHSAGDNPIKNGMSFDETEKSPASYHSASMAYGAIGAETPLRYDLSKSRLFASGQGVTRFTKDQVDGGLWRMLTDVPKSDRSFAAWRAATPAEQARRDLARDAVIQFRQPIDQTLEDKGWNDKTRKEYVDLSTQIVEKLKLKASQVGIVDGWVRQIMGMPDGQDTDGNQLGQVTAKQALEAAKDILWNVDHRYLPTMGAEVPMLHIHDLQAIFRANQGRTDGWKVRESMDSYSSYATQWEDWVKISLGSAITSEQLFDPLYLVALDGFMHGYQNATRDLIDLPVSHDALVAQNLLDPETNRLLVSLSPDVQQIVEEPILLDVARATLDEMIGGNRISNGKLAGKAAPASEVAKRQAARRRWRKENGVPLPVDVTMRNFRKNGTDFVDHGTTTNALMRSLIHLRVGTALINPALWVSMGPEQWIRGALDRAANLITGQGTVGRTARTQAAISARLEDTAVGNVLEQLGLVTAYTPEQLVELNKVYNVLGQRNDFKAMIYQDLLFQQPNIGHRGRIEHWLEGYAKFGSRMQDPTWGMRANTMARRYLEAALQHIMATPTMNALSVETLIAELRTNPKFLQTNFPEAHAAGTAALAQLRSLKPTPLSLALRGVYEPLSESSNSAFNIFGNLVLKLPLMFSGYALNVLTTLTGMQGVSDMTAMFLEGRDKPGFIRRAQAAMRGEPYDPDKQEQFDMSTVLEGIDLSRSFIRGSLTHTGLFALGMAAGGLGLTGEDDETRRRRRAAELQGAGFVYDPRRIENDFRNAEAVFLDWLPFGLDSYFRVTTEDSVGGARSMGQLHWMLKQFVSPVIGMERFFDTGDFRQIGWGFQDALGSFPLINTLMWNDAVETANELAKAAKDEEKLGGPTNMVNAGAFLTSAVGVYERMLFENAFVNSLYQSFDRYDRDPYAQPLLDSDETIQVDAAGQPRETTFTEQYVDPETGEVREGYMARDAGAAKMHALTENRATLAFAMSLFTGLGDSDYLRTNMVPKTRQIEKEPVALDDAKGYIAAAYRGSGQVQQSLTIEEAEVAVRNQLHARDGRYYGDDVVLPLAKQFMAQQAGQGQYGALSIVQDGREHLTKEGARGLFQGLYKGSVNLGDASLSGVYVTFEMRNEIQKEWMQELIQEGVDLGLDETKANARMKRIWYGPTSDPTVQGLGELLWSKDLSYSDTLEYNQLNTTYVMGPDGRPWATGFTRDGVLGALGLKPLKRAYVSESGAMSTDSRLNSTDLTAGINTGLRALEPVAEDVPTDAEIGKAIEDAMREAGQQSYTPFTPYASGGGGGYSRGGGYGGGGYSSSGYANFSRMLPLPTIRTPYGNDVPFINTSNPFIRRADIRRERVWSERGRLKQWQ